MMPLFVSKVKIATIKSNYKYAQLEPKGTWWSYKQKKQIEEFPIMIHVSDMIIHDVKMKS